MEKTLSPEDLREAAKVFFRYAMQLNRAKHAIRHVDRKPKRRGRPMHRRNLDQLLANFVREKSAQN